MVSPRIILEGAPGAGEYLYADLFETAPEFLSGVFRWVMMGCPMPKEGGEDKGLDADALANFPDKKRKGKRARARNNVKGRGSKPVATHTQSPGRT